jgi:hypothetical protein
MKVTGVVDADRAADLDDGLDVARTFRSRGPIVVDLSGVEAITASALLSLMRAVQDAKRADRTLTVRGLLPAKILTSRLRTDRLSAVSTLSRPARSASWAVRRPNCGARLPSRPLAHRPAWATVCSLHAVASHRRPDYPPRRRLPSITLGTTARPA